MDGRCVSNNPQLATLLRAARRLSTVSFSIARPVRLTPNSCSLAMKYFIRLYTGLPYPDLNDKVAVANFHLSTRDQSLTSSILSCGTFFGALIAGDVADFVGRRVTIITGCFIFTIGCIFETASVSNFSGCLPPERHDPGVSSPETCLKTQKFPPKRPLLIQKSRRRLSQSWWSVA